jgi:myo-inositol-1-phosphate synthase
MEYQVKNAAGNRDGLVLDDPDNFKTKEVSKLGLLDEDPVEIKKAT